MSGSTLKRRSAYRVPRDRVYVLTEGEVTEVEYLRAVCNKLGLPKELVIIQKAHSTQAKGMVDEIVDLKKQNARNARKGKDASIEQWWIVVDTECRPDQLGEAIQKAKANRIFLALSDPSFEFWLRLHFGYTTASYGSVEELMKDLRHSFLPGYDVHSKHPDMGTLLPLLPTAMKNARQLRRNHTCQGMGQPRTDCDLLVDSLAAQAKPDVLTFSRERFDPNFLSMNLL